MSCLLTEGGLEYVAWEFSLVAVVDNSACISMCGACEGVSVSVSQAD